MSDASSTVDALRHLRDALKQPVTTLSSLTSLLVQPLALLSLLPYSLNPSSSSEHVWHGSREPADKEVLLGRFLGSLQGAVLEHVVPVWWDVLKGAKEGGAGEESQGKALLESWFCPILSSDHKGKGREDFARRVAITSYQSIISQLSTKPSPIASSSSSASPPPAALSPSTLSFILASLTSLSESYPLTCLYRAIFSPSSSSPILQGKRLVVWESLARTLISVPAKVANVTQGGKLVDVPKGLEREIWYTGIVGGLEEIVWEESEKGEEAGLAPLQIFLFNFSSQAYISSTPFSHDLLPPHPPHTFFSALLPLLISHLNLPSNHSSSSPTSRPAQHAKLWRSLFANLPLSSLVRVAESLLQHLIAGIRAQTKLTGAEQRPKKVAAMVRRAGGLMRSLIGSGEELESVMDKVLIGWEGVAGDAEGTELRARIGVCWIGGSERDRDALQRMLSKALAVWTDPQYIKFSLASRQIYLTTLLYLLLTSFPPFSASSTKIASSSIFLSSLSSYLGHPDKTVRGLGMMFAEIVSEQTIREDDTIVATGEAMKRLRFGIWEGEGEWRKVAKRIRSMEGDWVAKGEAHDPLVDGEAMIGWAQTTTRASPSQPKSHPSPRSSPPPKPVPPPKSTKSKKPKRIEPLSDSDDSLSGYLSSSSTTSSTFEPENLDQYLTDPTLYTPAKKLPQRPVYLAQLLSYLSAREDPDKLDCALKWGEALVRRKRGFGLELEENAVGLSVYLAGLDDGFELVDFENRKQGLMNALVACEPRKTAPTLIEQYFGSQYSLHQRSAILEALAMGAREVASLPTLKAPNQPSIDWPSKKLPPALHDKFVSGGDVVRPPLLGGEDAKGKGRLAVRGRIEEAARELGGEAIEKGREEAEEKVGEIRREKQLRVRQKTTASATAAPSPQTPHPTSTAFQDVAAEYFLLPLINRLWTHYTEQCTLRHRFATTTQAHTSAGTGMILSPLSLSKLLATLSVLSHAARHSPVFLAVLAPQLLELAVKLGASPLAASSSAEFSAEGEGEEVSVLTTSLELTLVTLDVSRDLDGGRTLMVDHGGLIEAAAEWGEMVFRRTESGQRVMGEGRGGEGFDEGVAGVRRASAGVCVIVGEMKERWGRLVGF